MKGLVHCFAGFLLVGLCSATTAGREFATSFMQNMGGDNKYTHFMVEVSALPTSQGSTKVKVTAVGNVYEKEIQPGKGVSFKMPDSVEMRGSKKFSQTVLIEASQDVTVQTLNFKEDTADTSVIYPVDEWGTEYYIFTPSSNVPGSFKEFSITNHKDGNSVEVFFLKGSATFEGKAYRKGSKLTIKLEPFESVQIQSKDDLSSTRVVSQHPVAVSTGHSCAEKYTACNHVYEQLLPVKSWGKEFIVAPLPFHPFYGYDDIIVQASQSTKITKNVGGKIESFPMFAGQTMKFRSEWPHTTHLTSDKGVQVLFEFTGGSLEGSDQYYDPFLMTILPTNKFSISYTLEGREEFSNAAILVVRSNDLDGVRIDTKPLPADLQWGKVEGTDYSWTELYNYLTVGFHEISHPKSPFAVYSIGLAVANGYGSPASDNRPVKRDCSTIKCPKDEECQMRGSTPTCVKKPPVIKTGTCWAMGDPHYRTFDGQYFNFMGNCTYTMAKNCHVDGSHPAFEVEAQNENRASSKVTFVGKVIIKVYGYTITIVRFETGFVRMDYTLWNLPINLDNGKVKLFQSGMSVVMETDFGLTVQYDWQQHLVITVPGSFAGKVCGLCGNFNSKDKDDLTTPTGSLASSVVALGKSWRVPGGPGDAHCRDECTGQCETCESGGFLEGLTDKLFCGLLTRIMDGPFSDCHAIIDPNIFHEICLYDVCMGEGMKNFLCNTLEVYSDACQRAGVKIHNWRRLAGCSDPACPENSHYEFCGSACPATCENPGAPSKCKASCVETCVCDEGFLLSGTKCVPKTQCGCMYKGRYVEAGATFLSDDHCTEKCKCNPANNKVACTSPGCQNGYECKRVDGLIGCHPKAYAHCSVSGDPHYSTFDGYTYNFQGTCVYQMAGVCSTDPSLEHFDVLVQNDARGKRVGSRTKLVEVNVYGTSIVISKSHKGAVLIKGEITYLPVNLNHGKITIYQIGDFAEINTDFGLQVSYDWNSIVFVTVPSRYAGAMCGMCGNYNNDRKDDLQMKNGRRASSPAELGKSWRVAEIPGCVDDCKDKNHCPNCDITEKEKFETNKYCGEIRNPNGPFRRCHDKINPQPKFESCVYDACLNNGKKGSWCNIFHAYMIECQRAGIKVDPWRRKDFCPVSKMKHPKNSHYEQCGSVCPVTCGTGAPPRDCDKPCEEGWLCNDGYLLSGKDCVPIDQCGCMYNDIYHKYGEVFYADQHCTEKCICNGTLQCTKSPCNENERCEMKNGVRSCQPVETGFCSVSGDPHYRTFDNGTYDFQGTCTYTAATACHLEGTQLTPFSVVVENEKWPSMTVNPNVSVAKVVAVEVYGNILILRRNQIGVVMLNGIATTIPLNLNEGQVQIYKEGHHYVIATDFGLRVTYDLLFQVTITVPGNYKGKTCGLCGNFNGNKEDEFRLPDGKKTNDLLKFGAAWKKSVLGVVCDDGCSGDLCPKCDSHLKPIFEKDCHIMIDANGPFAKCHNIINPHSYYRDCVYDVCMSQGDSRVLCHSIAAYMSDCQDFGVQVGNWRTPQFCPLSCPAHSHYQLCSEVGGTPCPGLTDIITYPGVCAEVCACDDGYYFNGTGCVTWEECSCYHNGRTFKIGESVLSDDCQELCTCTSFGYVECEEHRCKLSESCAVKNGSRGCYSKQCQIQTGGSFTLFSGTNGIITVMGAYEMITHCDQSAVDWFRVVVKLQECSLTGLKSVAAIYVYFNDLAVTVTDREETWVNGKKVSLPNVPRNDISVRVIDKTTVIEQRSGFRLSYSLTEEVIVTVSDSMQGKVCGACGKVLPARNLLGFSQDMMQEYVSAFVAEDFPTCGL